MQSSKAFGWGSAAGAVFVALGCVIGFAGVLGADTAHAAGAQAQTVKDLLELDARMAREKLAPVSGAAASKLLAAQPVSAAATAQAARTAAASVQAPKMQDIRVDAIYGTMTFGSDNRRVDVHVDGRYKTLTRGAVFAGYQLQSIEGSCAVFVVHSRAAKGQSPAQGEKTHLACLDEAPLATGTQNVLVVPPGNALPMPSPVYRPPFPVGASTGSVSSTSQPR
jgi:hypothetical protein